MSVHSKAAAICRAPRRGAAPSVRLTAALLASVVLASCGQRASPAASAAVGAPDPGYLPAPQVTQLARGPDGSFTLEGRAMPSSQVRLASPFGARLDTTADGKGDWRAPLGPISEPVLYGLSAALDGRRVQAEGYVAIIPGGPTVALLRAGAGAMVLDDDRPALRLLAVDVDSGGGTVVSGRTATNAPVRVLVDGAGAIEAAPASDRRFSLTLPKALPPGPHHIEIVAVGGATADAAVTVGPIPPPPEGPYQATPSHGGWRIDWMTPGMGLQTTLLTPPEARR